MPIAAGPAILGAAAIGGVASVAAGAIGANSANQAAQVQQDAAVQAAQIQADSANRSADISNAQYQQSRQDQLPWLDAGRKALAQYQGELGLSTTGADGGAFKSEFATTPDYDFQVQQGEKGVINNLSALGLRGSGAALKALTKFRQNLADQTYGNYLTRLSNLATGGQQAANDNATLGAQNAANVGNAIVAAGNAQAGGLTDAAAARASGYVGGGNAWSNALGNIGNSAGNTLGYLSAMPKTGWAA
jgi:hypothetical protein